MTQGYVITYEDDSTERVEASAFGHAAGGFDVFYDDEANEVRRINATFDQVVSIVDGMGDEVFDEQDRKPDEAEVVSELMELITDRLRRGTDRWGAKVKNFELIINFHRFPQTGNQRPPLTITAPVTQLTPPS